MTTEERPRQIIRFAKPAEESRGFHFLILRNPELPPRGQIYFVTEEDVDSLRAAGFTVEVLTGRTDGS